MAGLYVKICAQECLEKTEATPEDIADLVDRQRVLGNSVDLSLRCLRVCTRFRQQFPEYSIAGARIDGTTTQGVELHDAAALAGRVSSGGEVVVKLINPPVREG